jgi:phosphohistidine phosphatase SixA
MVTVLLVRHADVDSITGAPDSEPLNVNGQKRAETLAQIAGPLRVDAIFTSAAVRTKETARPLAAKLGLVAQVATANLATQLGSGVVGKVVLVVGHSNTVPQLIQALGGPASPTIVPSQFDNLFIVAVTGPGQAKMVRLKYGRPTP